MTALYDVRKIENSQREAIASRIRVAKDFELPQLTYWNYDLCRDHRFGWQETYFNETLQTEMTRTVTDRPKPMCRKCAIHPRRHQRVGAMWLYFKMRGLLADVVGSGKTTHAGLLIAMMKEAGELETNGRVIVCCRAPAILQWQSELHRMIPTLSVITGMGQRKDRMVKYSQPWDVLVIGPEMLRNDHKALIQNIKIGTLIVDDVDALRHRENITAKVLRDVGAQAKRMVIMTGTPLQKKLHELYGVLEPLGGRDIFGDEKVFMRRYVRTEPITTYSPVTGRKSTQNKVVGYKNLHEFKALIEPLALRRTAADIDDVNLPEVVTEDVLLDLYPLQREQYEELRQGVIRIVREGKEKVTRATAFAKILYGQQICGGLGSLNGPEADIEMSSVKMDWLMDKISDGGDLDGEKVVVFAQYKNTIKSLHQRFQRAGIGYETIWGDEPDKTARQRSQDRFWEDKNCRVLIGTQAIEQSLNLQVARHLINMDMILNPARMEQLAGRIRRDGSAYKHVYVHNLLTVDTQEERYLPLLEQEAALSSFIWDESNQLFNALNPVALMQLITG